MKYSKGIGKNLEPAGLSLLILSVASLGGCSLQRNSSLFNKHAAMTDDSASLDSTATNSALPGFGSVHIPVGDAIVSRLENGLMDTRTNKDQPSTGVNRVTSTNFRNALALVKGNLPTTVHPLNATGYDQIPLLVYAACADVNAGTAMSAYGLDFTTASTSPATRSKLIAAGVKILDQHVAGLASSGPAATEVANVFGKLIDDNNTPTAATTSLNFISICMAANTFGISMRGF